MEKKTLNGWEELALKAMVSKNWLGGTPALSTAGLLELCELDFDWTTLGEHDVASSQALTLEITAPEKLTAENLNLKSLPGRTKCFWSVSTSSASAYALRGSVRYSIGEEYMGSLESELTTFAAQPKRSKVIVPLPFRQLKAHFSQEVLHFCILHKLEEHLQLAIELIREFFSSAQKVDLQIEQDPDIDDEWLTLDFTIAGDIKEILDTYNNYTDQWVSLVPWPERDKIRLSYNIT